MFIHGLWTHATSWENWITLFRENGYEPTAPGWPGDADSAELTRKNAVAVADRGIAEVTDHYARIVTDLPTPPVLVGHSFGGLIVQRLLGMGYARGGVAVAPSSSAGARPVARAVPLHVAGAEPSRHAQGHLVLTPESFRRSFANGVSREESDRLYRSYAIPAPARPLFQAALANFTPHSEASVDTRRARGPLLMVAASVDRTVPATTVRAAFRVQLKNKGVTEFKQFEGRGTRSPSTTAGATSPTPRWTSSAATGSPTATDPPRAQAVMSFAVNRAHAAEPNTPTYTA
ncbi:alpha/beta hydrolase [Streptomyces sp. M19]